jgi:hypothetical protein
LVAVGLAERVSLLAAVVRVEVIALGALQAVGSVEAKAEGVQDGNTLSFQQLVEGSASQAVSRASLVLQTVLQLRKADTLRQHHRGDAPDAAAVLTVVSAALHS